MKTWLFCLCLSLTSSCVYFKKPLFILKVGKETWTSEEFTEELQLYVKDFRSPEFSLKKQEELKKQVLRDLTIGALIENWSKGQNLTVKKTKTLESLEKFPLIYSAESKNLKKRSNQMELREVFLRRLNKGTKPFSKKSLLQFYSKNKEKFYEAPACKLQQIFTESRPLSRLIQKRLRQKKSFSKIAKLFSESPEGKEGGNLPWLAQGTLGVFDQACKLEIGKISPILKSPYGFHILKVKEKKKGYYKPFSKVSKDIQKKMKEGKLKEKFETWLKEELRKTPVFINEKLLAQIHIRYRNKKTW